MWIKQRHVEVIGHVRPFGSKDRKCFLFGEELLCLVSSQPIICHPLSRCVCVWIKEDAQGEWVLRWHIKQPGQWSVQATHSVCESERGGAAAWDWLSGSFGWDSWWSSNRTWDTSENLTSCRKWRERKLQMRLKSVQFKSVKITLTFHSRHNPASTLQQHVQEPAWNVQVLVWINIQLHLPES